MKLQSILKCEDVQFRTGNIDLEIYRGFKQLIPDLDYYSYILESSNGGFYFHRSLHLYGFSKQIHYHNIQWVNEIFSKQYGFIAENLLVFGQDIFGNQFAFDLKSYQVILFNIESGERTFLAPNFSNWVDVLLNDVKYFTGEPIAIDWHSSKTLNYNERLIAKIPFVLGGDFTIENLYSCESPKHLEVGSNIAHQIYNLPDGTKFEMKIE